MAIPSVGQKYLITFVGELCNQKVLNTFWYSLEDVGAAASVNAVYDIIQAQLAIATLLADDFRGACPENYTHQQTWIQAIKPDRIMKRIVNVNLDGTFASTAATANLAAVIERRAEIADRKSVSTLHVPLPEPVDVGVSGIITVAAYKTRLETLATEMLQNITSGGGAPTVLKPVVFNPKPAAPPGNRFVIQTTVQDTVRVMRRRTVGLGI